MDIKYKVFEYPEFKFEVCFELKWVQIEKPMILYKIFIELKITMDHINDHMGHDWKNWIILKC